MNGGLYNNGSKGGYANRFSIAFPSSAVLKGSNSRFSLALRVILALKGQCFRIPKLSLVMELSLNRALVPLTALTRLAKYSPVNPGVGRRCLAVAIMLCIALNGVPVFPATTPADTARDLIKMLNPVSLALTPLIDDAIAKADSKLQQRLLQLQAIITEALQQLNDIAEQRIVQVDKDASNRLEQLKTEVYNSQAMFNSIVARNIRTADDIAAKRVLDLQDKVGNLIAGLPIPIEPHINIGDKTKGILLPKQVGTETVLYLTGVGLFKDSSIPTAYLINPAHSGQKSTSWLPASWRRDKARTEVPVGAHSMGLIELRIPNRSLSDDPHSDYTLELSLRRGSTWLVKPSYSTPSFPLHVCGSLPPYSGEIVATAKGDIWDKRTIAFPGSTSVKGHNNGFYVDDGAKSADRCAKDANVDGWDVDPNAGLYSAPAEHNGTNGYGLSVGSAGSDRYGRVYPNTPKKGCVHLYSDDREGPAFVWIGDVVVHQRRTKATDRCAKPVAVTKSLEYGSANQMRFNPSDTYGECQQAGISRTPDLKVTFSLRDKNGKIVEEADLTPGAELPMQEGRVTVLMTNQGLVTVNLGAVCQWKPQPIVR
jgi:hypothetical protein